jgi:hypothetical protein
MRRLGAIAGCALVAVGAAGCESSQDKSAQLAKSGAGKASTSLVKAGAANTDVVVGQTAVLRGAGGASAAVVVLRNRGPRAQAGIPVQIEVTGAGRKVVYKNDLAGLQIALQQLAYLAPGEQVAWVNDQVTASATPKAVQAQVSRPTGGTPAGKPPKVVLVGTRLEHDSTGVYLTGTVRNESKVAQTNLPIYAVARRGSRIVAAGRAIIERLEPEPQSKPTIFRIFFVGDPKGATLDVQPVPTVLEGR